MLFPLHGLLFHFRSLVIDPCFISCYDSWEKFLDLLHQVQKFSSENWNLQCFWCRGSILVTENWLLIYPGDDQNRLFWHTAFLSNCRHLQAAVLHDQDLNFLEHSWIICFQWPSSAEATFDGFFIPLEMLTPILHWVFGKHSITIHSQHPFTVTFGSLPHLWEVRYRNI
jgi:hypothetical protein